MGIYDREYYRREGPGFLRYLSEHGKICKWLIGINVVCFVVQTLTTGDQQHPDWFTQNLDLNAAATLQGEVWRLLTAAFLHDPGSIWHILFNMIVLWWAGSEMEDLYGSWEFLLFYLVGAVLGNLAQLGFYVATTPGPELIYKAAYGASGAINAVLVLFAFHYPFRRVLVMWVIPMPVWLLVVLALAIDTFGFLGVDPHVGHAAHLGGAAFGLVYYKLHWRFLNLFQTLQSWRKSRPRLRVYREEEPAPRAPVSVATAPRSDVDEHLEAKLDQVLEKVARHGQDSLTESERQILFRASEVYKKRRS